MFSEISSWIVSIAGIICLSVIVEIILPNGQMNQYIKRIFAFIIVFVIISPLPKLLNIDTNFSNIFNSYSEIVVDETYVAQLNLDKLNALKKDIEALIEKRGYGNVEVYLNGDITGALMSVKAINVDLSNLRISENAEHSDITKIKTDITNIILTKINIEEENILYAC